MIILDEAPDKGGSLGEGGRGEIPATLQTSADAIKDQHEAPQHPVLPHQVFRGSDICGLGLLGSGSQQLRRSKKGGRTQAGAGFGQKIPAGIYRYPRIVNVGPP